MECNNEHIFFKISKLSLNRYKRKREKNYLIEEYIYNMLIVHRRKLFLFCLSKKSRRRIIHSPNSLPVI